MHFYVHKLSLSGPMGRSALIEVYIICHSINLFSQLIIFNP